MHLFHSFIIILSVNLLLQVHCFHRSFYHSLSNLRHYSVVADKETTEIVDEKVLIITENAAKHLESMKSNQPKNAVLRIGVKKGGCSGMSYDMNFITEADILETDHIEYFDSIKCAMDPKSLLFLFGMQLDYR